MKRIRATRRLRVFGLAALLPIGIATSVLCLYLNLGSDTTTQSQVGIFTATPTAIHSVTIVNLSDGSLNVAVAAESTLRTATPVELFITGVDTCNIPGSSPTITASVIPTVVTLSATLNGVNRSLVFFCRRQAGLFYHLSRSKKLILKLANPVYASTYVTHGYSEFPSALVRATTLGESKTLIRLNFTGACLQ